ncbi:hypothetical protein, partial [Sulfurimonas sp.]|uniref:SDH family Clp fold serine proteinase n=1 Tax=Sulfurimonas sp. TaxID=2022749 RepID=UPI0025EE9FB2
FSCFRLSNFDSLVRKVSKQNKKDCAIYMYSNPDNIGIYNNIKCGVSSSKRMLGIMEHLSTTGKFISFEKSYGELQNDDLLNFLQNNMKKVSTLRARPVLAYLSAVNKNVSSNLINISNEDIKHFVNLINDVPENIQEIDIILHSRGGYMIVARQLVEIIRKRFKKVTYIIPYIAHSAAAMMTMSGDEIIMTPESSMSPFDVQMPSPASNEYYPAAELKKIANEARHAHNPFNPFISKALYKDWDSRTIRKIIFDCSISISMTKNYTIYWLMKYMFNNFKAVNYKFSYYLVLPWWIRLTKNGRTAHKIASFFTNPKIHIAHNNPVMFNDISDIGLNIQCADSELLSILRETYILTDELFDRSIFTKLYINDKQHVYTHKKEI